ncbi:type VI secretion system protein TssA [Ideonella azotifigens]|uniref:Type VI secretion system protein TssA n=2 Tax=Ideonella azotifigens TaxID=513160 RepID=A0ABP3V7V4_9BURK|nr:type VI secretion system protein TssA [Ideonella azotifigens]MCD2341543.1 type VI secretion system protein TssA [Ideonella azotifigens]
MELESLLAPVSPAQPGGVDMSLSAEVDAIQDMRREDDPTLDQGEWVATLKVADWPGVARASEALLRERSKDLRVAGWLTEALARVHGFQGLADGLALCAGLLDRHWAHLHPLPDDGDQEERIGNLGWLSGQVQALSRQIVLVPRGAKGYSLAEIESARARRLAGESDSAASPSSGAGKAGEPPLTLELVQRTLSGAGLRAYEAQVAQVERARSAWQALERAVDARLGQDGPSFVGPRRALEAAHDALSKLGREAGLVGAPLAAADASEAAQAELAAAGPGPAGGAVMPGRIQSRAQALEQLRLVAEYFRATEPHSPVAYLADKAARWGTMPLHDWLRAVVKDGGSLAHVEELLGIERRDDNG